MYNWKQQAQLLWSVFWSFFKIGPVTFGGGYAMIPVIEREVIGRRQWISEQEMSDALSIAGSAPGGIGVNVAAFIGYRLAGIAGAVAAVVGITLPTFVIIFLMCISFVHFQGNEKLQAALLGIRAAVTGLIIVAAIRMGKTAIKDKTTMAAVIATVLILLFSSIHPLLVMIGGLAAGVVTVWIKERMGYSVKLDNDSDDKSDTRVPSPYKYADYYIGDGI